jgi:hypothetical protein
MVYASRQRRDKDPVDAQVFHLEADRPNSENVDVVTVFV